MRLRVAQMTRLARTFKQSPILALCVENDFIRVMLRDTAEIWKPLVACTGTANYAVN